MISEVYNMDCMGLLKSTPDNFYDLLIADVPYGIGEDGRNNHSRGKLCKAKDYRDKGQYDNESPQLEYFTEAIRVSKNQIFWGANHFISKIPYDSPAWFVWDKDNGDNDFADCEIAYTSFKTAIRRYKYRWHGMLQQNMKDKEVRIHPNQKPIQVNNKLLELYAKPNDKILDTHSGSQSLRIACYDKFDYTGCEIDYNYYTDGEKRFKNHVSQTVIKF